MDSRSSVLVDFLRDRRQLDDADSRGERGADEACDEDVDQRLDRAGQRLGQNDSTNDEPEGMPSARAASICPFGTELIPLRTVSHTNPDEENISATTTDQKSGIVIPTWGSARPMSTMRHRFGMLQATVTHAAPSARSGGMGRPGRRP